MGYVQFAERGRRTVAGDRQYWLRQSAERGEKPWRGIGDIGFANLPKDAEKTAWG